MIRTAVTQTCASRCASLTFVLRVLIVAACLVLWQVKSPEAQADTLGLVKVGGGLTHLDPSGKGLTSKNGYHLLASAHYQWAREVWRPSFGLGVFYNRLYSDGERTFPGSSPETIREQRNLRIETRAALVDLDLMRAMGADWQMGLALRTLAGSSLSFGQDRDTNRTIPFLGPRIRRELSDMAGFRHSLEGDLAMSLGAKGKTLYLAGVTLVWGQATAKTAEPAVPSSPPPPADEYTEVFADKVIHFATGSSQLNGPSKNFVRDLGQFLHKRRDLWSHLTVEGHTDKKGRLEYNMKLSQDRADAVRDMLLEQGLSAQHIAAKGYGPTRPVQVGDSPEALSANRRVVLVFKLNGNDARSSLSKEILKLRKTYFGE